MADVPPFRVPLNATRNQRRHAGLTEATVRRPVDAGPLTFGFADPPYPGQSARHYGQHADFAGEVDHAALVERLMDEYPDGWLLCSGAQTIPELAQLLPSGTRTLAWCKPMTPYKPGVSVQHGWEPVFMWGGRRRGRDALMLRDWFVCSPVAWRAHGNGGADAVIGMKPDDLCQWLFQCLGARPGDDVVDLFPGSGAVAKAWERFSAQGRLC